MRIIRVQYNEFSFYAAIGDENTVQCLHGTLGINKPIPISSIKILPLVSPSKIICIALNYHERAHELQLPIPNKPAFFLKPPSSIIGNGQPIILPPNIDQVEINAELCIVIGQTCYNVSPEAALNYIFGYTCANDVTIRGTQESEYTFGYAKSYNTFCPVGPWIETDVSNIEQLQIKCTINNEIQQIHTTADMIFPPTVLISFLSHIMTLNPGDLILTGTPRGSSLVKNGDLIQITIENIGLLFNPVEEYLPIESIIQ